MKQVSNPACGHWPPSPASFRELHTQGLLVSRTSSIQLSEEHLNKGQAPHKVSPLPLFPCLSVFCSFVFSLPCWNRLAFSFVCIKQCPCFSISQEQGGIESPPDHLESASYPQHGISGAKSTAFSLLQDSLQFGG